MATITPGSGGTFVTETAEGRLIDAVCLLQSYEADSAKNSSGRTAVSGSFSIEDLTFTGAYSLPAEQTISNSGSLTIAATPYLTGATFTPGAGSPTFKSTTIEAYCLEVLQYLQILERNTAKNPQNKNFVSGTFNSDTGVYSGTFSIPVTLEIATVAPGGVTFNAVEYLL